MILIEMKCWKLLFKKFTTFFFYLPNEVVVVIFKKSFYFPVKKKIMLCLKCNIYTSHEASYCYFGKNKLQPWDASFLCCCCFFLIQSVSWMCCWAQGHDQLNNTITTTKVILKYNTEMHNFRRFEKNFRALSPSQPEFVTSAKGLSHVLHWRPITPGLHWHWPVSGSHEREKEPTG